MEKTAAPKTYKDPTLNKIIQEKAVWNRQVSALINDLIHFKKSVNGWPSKFYKERTRITQPVPIDLTSILGKISGEFQEIANSGNGILQEQANFAKTHIKKHTDNTLDKLDQTHGPANGPTPTAPKPGGPDLSQQMGQKMSASIESELIKLGSDMELKYELEVMASNPFSRFITRLFNPKFGFGEAARIRRLRMAMLDNCVKSYKEIKKLHKEIVKSSKNSIVVSHKMMTQIWNYWNAVNRLFSTYKAIRPSDIIKDPGGQIETDPDLKREKAIEEGRDPEAEQGTPPPTPVGPAGLEQAPVLVALLKDYRTASAMLAATKSPAFHELNSIVESVMAAPKDKKAEVLLSTNINDVYSRAIQEVNTELGTNGTSFKEIATMKQKLPVAKEAQRQLGKIRHQLLPGATSGQRLEIYQFITQIRKDLDEVMNLLESGFDQDKLTTAIGQVNREMAALRTMMRSLYYSEKPEEASSPFM
jgi:hypothetical protein